MSDQSDLYVAAALPGDNRSPLTRYIDDVRDLDVAAGVLRDILDSLLLAAPVADNGTGFRTIALPSNLAEQVEFMSWDVSQRAAALRARHYLIDPDPEDGPYVATS